ncbi:ABC transporter substrate-binding protein [Microtetraspora malaysiensis]|uniref:ABC transporter substrate-binding protein n=1 Tax=Microtetraspora malaysiensis TaxID=161358 RepID=UPI0008368BFE|nr:ABC transporter substrate-binding protein [Microtetraspora malaysiensis]
MSRRRLAAVAAFTLLPGTALAGTAHADTAEITIATCAPYRTMTVGDADSCGADVLTGLFTGLTRFDPATSRSTYAVAKSITTKDNRVFHVTLRKGWKFHDGTEVLARNFVEAWNLSASERAGNAFLFEEIQGYGTFEKSTRRMSGLKVTGSHTFTITLTKPFGPFLNKLSHVAFSPLPDSVLKNPASFQKKPIGNGPFRVVSWSPSSTSVLERFDGYAGTVKPSVSTIAYRAVKTGAAAYSALLSGEIDFSGFLPTSGQLTDVKTKLGGRLIHRAGGTIQIVAFPTKVAANADFRKAVSMAIDREAITKDVFFGVRVPAHSFTPPVAEGSRRDACGQVCEYNPAEARKYLAKALASGFRPPAVLPLYYNADSVHGEWIKPLVAGLNKVFEGKVKFTAKAKGTFDAFERMTRSGKLDGMYRAGWQLDFPHIQNAVGPMFASDGIYDGRIYRSAKFDALLRAADRERSSAKAIRLYQRAEDQLVKDLPAIPLWNYGDVAGYSERIAKAALTPYGWLDPMTVKLA